ncbi:hypothetical protein BIV57_13235 [Mangrovactinospora gilvigrisea]|uniref:Phosphoribosyltransferase domain-containing protein n=1 Tax=Mangrovactinospora gilvigrisea TaxID=1428644 RepID=A0A1J7BE40_9ACTN|nr:phosphoribosyltransferase [Mangrovactinospora gilvigrisea]OIV36951.1 hypothetical protein BIV57_13235 [Mangrovactinospora gilvigrisea]
MEEMAAELALRIAADGQPSLVVGVLRHGMVPAVLIADRLAVAGVRAFDPGQLDPTTPEADEPPAYRELRNLGAVGPVPDADVLVIAWTDPEGHALAAARRTLEAAGARRVRTAVCLGPPPPDSVDIGPATPVSPSSPTGLDPARSRPGDHAAADRSPESEEG